MAKKVKVDLDNLPKGALVEVPNLGAFENGSTTEVSDARWERFVTHDPVGQHYADEDMYEVSTAKQKADTEAYASLSKSDPEDEKKAELVDRARLMGIDDPSSMTVDQLREAIAEREAVPTSYTPVVDTDDEEDE